jgi:hypothetical protein
MTRHFIEWFGGIMFRRIAILCFLVLAACSVSGTPAPNVTPPPTTIVLPTLPPAGPTILASDLGKAPPTLDPSQEAVVATATPTVPPPVTPAAVGFDFALRPQFAQDLNLVENKSVYTMKWVFNDDLTAIQGTQRVIFANRTGKPLNEIYFRLFANYPNSEANIEIHDVRVSGAQVDTALEQENTALRISLTRPLTTNRPLPISLDYTIQIPSENTVRYADFNRTDWITTLPTVYPIIPAYDAKGWHIELPPPYGDLVYADSSIYDVTITLPSQYNVIASGQLVQETNEGALTTRRFIGAPMRDFDANITNVLTKTSDQVDDIIVNSWYLPDHVESGERALDWVVNAMQIFEKRFGAYPFKELDLVETPTLAGGIEYPGLITVASNLYADPGQLNFFEFATVHETAHQWFYSTVGSDQVNHPWLDEALTQYATLIYFEDRYGKDVAHNIQENFFDQQYETAKRKYGDKPAGLPVSAYDEDAYGAFVYSKGPKFFQAVRDQIGNDAFFEALRSYYDQFKFRIATPADLIQAFNTASGQDITPLYKQWIGQ